jgi:hypothetical protein
MTDSTCGTSLTADVSGHRCIDFGIIRSRVALDESRRAHDLTGLTVTALDDLKFEPRLLDPAPALLLPDGFDRRHFARVDIAAGNMQDRTGRPSTCTVHAPH